MPVVLAILEVGMVVSIRVRRGGKAGAAGGGCEGGVERDSLSDFGQVAGTDLLS